MGLLCPGAAQWRGQPHAPPYWGSPECYDRGEYQQCPLGKDLPIGGLPTFAFRMVSHCPHDPNGASFPYPPWCVEHYWEILQQCHLPTSATQIGCSGGEGIWACHSVGTPLPNQGFYHRQHSWAAHPAGLHWAQLALCPGTAQWRSQPHAPPYQGSPECYDRGEYQQCPLGKDLPIGGLPTPELRPLGGLPRRTQ